MHVNICRTGNQSNTGKKKIFLHLKKSFKCVVTTSKKVVKLLSSTVDHDIITRKRRIIKNFLMLCMRPKSKTN